MVGLEKTWLYLLILIYVWLPLISLTVGKGNWNLESAFICNISFDQPYESWRELQRKYDWHHFAERPDWYSTCGIGHTFYSNKKIKNPLRKIRTRLKQTLHKRYNKWLNKAYEKKYQVILVIREIQIKTTTRYKFTQEWLKLKTDDTKTVGKDTEQLEFSYIAGGKKKKKKV